MFSIFQDRKTCLIVLTTIALLLLGGYCYNQFQTILLLKSRLSGVRFQKHIEEEAIPPSKEHEEHEEEEEESNSAVNSKKLLDTMLKERVEAGGALSST